jgi:hypothetical protein
MWFQVSEKEARDKVGQALRDAIKIVRGSNSRRKTAGEGRDKIDKSTVHKRKKMRTGARDYEAPQLKGPSHAETSSLKMALSSRSRFDPTAGNANSTRSFLENQVNALGPFPMSSGGLRGGWEDSEGNNVKSMLGSVIEPLDSFTGQQSIDLTKLNRKRRLSLSQDPFGTGSRQQPSSLFDDHMEHMAQKRALQMIGNSEFGSAVPTMGALRRLSILDFQDGGQQIASMTGLLDGATNLQSNAAGVLGLSSLGTHHQRDLDVNNMTAQSALSYRLHQEGSEALQQAQAHAAAPQQSVWDLEPTPISGAQQSQPGINRQRMG